MKKFEYPPEIAEQITPVIKEPASQAKESSAIRARKSLGPEGESALQTAGSSTMVAPGVEGSGAKAGIKKNAGAKKKEEYHSRYLQRSHHHDYCRPARYMITLMKSPVLPPLSKIIGNPRFSYPNENAPGVELTVEGLVVEKAIQLWLAQYTGLRIRRYVIMPDHVHICLQVMDYIKQGLGSLIGNFMGKCSRLRHDALYARHFTSPDSTMVHKEQNLLPQTAGAAVCDHVLSGPPRVDNPYEMVKFFRRGFNDRIAYNDGQWERQQRYTDDNPRRYLIKRQHPDLYFKRWLITTEYGQNFVAQGNIMLLRNPDLQVVRFSRRFSDTYYVACIENWEKCVENNGVLVSPFIHPKEREIRDRALSNGGAIIRICENGFGDRFVPQGKEFDYNGTSKLLLIAPVKHKTKNEDMTRAKAMNLNSIAGSIASIDWLSGRASIKAIS